MPGNCYFEINSSEDEHKKVATNEDVILSQDLNHAISGKLTQ
jgi:hypothetical protein